MLVSPGRPWPWPLQQYTVFYELPYTGRLVFESQADYASPAYWPSQVLQQVAV
jgi:peptide methionine sulfoxide reductase MsrB